MSIYIALRDRRLAGGVPARSNLAIINTDEHTPLTRAFQAINSVAQVGGGRKVRAMFIMCHGYAGQNQRAQMSMDAGGMGLQLGRENVLHGNVSLWAAIKNRVENIVVYSCAASNTESGNEYTVADGRYLMGALAIVTNASVFAADRIQWYSTYKGLSNGRFEWGAWEGKLWHFPPSGGQPTQVLSAPVEFSNVMDGSAP